jgi:hypothetical protein
MTAHTPSPALDPMQVERFIADGFVRLDDAFPRALAEECRAILWRDTGASPDDPATWTKPVVRLGMYGQAPFRAAANTPALHGAYDALVGAGRWLAPGAVGTFPVRFPHADDPGDGGWHIDVSFGTEDPDFMSWRANVTSRGRSLLLLMLFSDVTEDDAPTRIAVGSHQAVARVLAPAGEAGMSLGELVADGVFDRAAAGPQALATGAAGTVYLCHPFLVHGAQRHRGTTPRFLAQPPLLPAEPLRLDGPSPVEAAIRLAL